jgi:DNA-binding NtrC family response regulator
VASLAAELQMSIVPEINAGDMKELTQYDWPGNVRELRNFLERRLILSSDSTLSPKSLRRPASKDASEWSVTVSFPVDRSLDDIINDLKRSFFKEAMRRAGGTKQEAARMLGISRFILTRQMKSLGVG